jgi:pimeloyl-ACP methyl ester carboxylesterase
VGKARTVLGRRRRSLLGLAAAGLLAGCSLPWQSSSGSSSDPAPGAGAGSGAPLASPSAPADDPASRPANAAFYGQKPNWTDCSGGFECTTVTVPVDWAAPGGETLKLAVLRRRATGDRLGSLFLNPGGPGVAGVEFLRGSVGRYAGLNERYDLVSWDPRGVGGSAPLNCLPNSALDAFFAEDATPDTPAEQQQFVADNKGFAAGCQAHSGALLRHVDTISTAKDMDVLRAVVADPRFTYLGGSYGTYLGGWYAELFPWRVGRLVLDGVVDPSLTSAQYAEGQAQGFGRAVTAYVDDCLSHSGCPLRGTREEAFGQLDAMMTRADARPLPSKSGRPVTQALLGTGLLQGMYFRQFWPVATRALSAALQGDGTTMLALADNYLERDENGRYGQTFQAYSPIYCLDHPETRSVEAIAADAARLKKLYPPFGDFIGWGAVNCAVWPYPGVVPAQRLTAPGSAPILVVGTTHDPATPYEWAQSLAKQLSSARLLTRVGEGHTAYGMGSDCTDRVINRYLLDGVVPAQDVTCS